MLDYDHVKHVVEVHVDARKSLTLESLAYDIAHDVLMLKPGEISVVVDIRKPSFQAGVSLAVSIEDLEARRNMLEVLESRRESTKEKKGG